MKIQVQEDIGEEIISKLKELAKILEQIMQEAKNGQECTFAYKSNK